VILIISNKGDIHCNPVIKHLVRHGDAFFRLNTDALLEDYEILFSVKENDLQLQVFNKINKKSFVLSDVKSIWERRPVSPEIPEHNNSQIRNVLDEEASEFVRWLRYFFANERSIGSSVWDRPNESKLRQMRIASDIIRENGLRVNLPTTFITNKKSGMIELATSFADLVVKPIGSDSIELDEKYEMSFVSRKISSNDIKKFSEDDVRLCPTFLQNYIEKEYELRITAVGSQFFCCKIDSQLLPEGKGKEDWREGYDYGLPQTWILIPEELADFCRFYLAAIKSSFGCFDFILDKNGVYFFLECNPNGQWMWMEEDIGIPISEAIANFLAFRAH